MWTRAMAEPILEAENITKRFSVYGRFGRLLPPVTYIQAVQSVSFKLYEGKTFGLVGESGSGKTTIGRMIAGLAKVDSGVIRFRGRDISHLSKEGWKFCRNDIQVVFQDPYSSLNPRQTAGAMLEESLVIQGLRDKDERRKRVLAMLEMTGLRQEYYFRYPHELSGGQRQRLALSRALIVRPKIIICDEPVSALDVSIQSQILNILKSLQREMRVTLFFITHDIRVVRHISDRIGVMCAGQIVEEADVDEIFARPQHPYTRSLFASVPGSFT
jgi:oligopeptide transport system ATP-binding protein